MLNTLIRFPLAGGLRAIALTTLPTVGDYIQYVDENIRIVDFNEETHIHTARVSKITHILGNSFKGNIGGNVNIIIDLELP